MRSSARWLCLLLVLTLSVAGFAQAENYWCPAQGVTYGVSLKRAPEHILHVDVVTHAPAETFQLPVWNGLYQVRDFSQYVNHVQAWEGVPSWLCDKCATREARTYKLDKTTWQVEASGDHPCVMFSYDVVADDSGPFSSSVDGKHAFLNWALLLVYRPEKRDVPVSVRLLDVPAGWHLRDTGLFGSVSADAMSNASASAATYDKLVDSPVEIGTFGESQFEQGGVTYHIAVDSAPADYDMQALQYMLRRITAAGIDWMQDRPLDQYTFLYHFPHGPAAGGMEHAYGTAIDSSADSLQRDMVNTVGSVSAHEFFHLWNVKRIRPQSLEPIDYTKEQYTRALWFSEGLTSTVSDILLMRAGLRDEKRALAQIAQQIGILQARSAHKYQSVEESSLDTWFDKYADYGQPQRSISYYNKGQILGFLIDLRMRQLTNGRRCLRDLFQYMNQRYAKRGEYFDDSEGVRLALQVLTGDDFRDFFSRYISGTDELPYDELFSYVGLRVIHRQLEQPYVGLTTSRGAGKPTTVLHVDDSSAAAKARILPGDLVLEVDGKPSNGDFPQALQKHRPGETMRLKVSSGGQEREVDLTVGLRKTDDYVMEDIPGVSPSLRERRTAFLLGESLPEAGSNR